MMNKLLIFFVLFGSFSAGQTGVNTPPAQTVTCPAGPGPVSAQEAAECPSETSQAPPNSLNEYPVRAGTNLNPGLTPGPTEFAPTPGTTPAPSTRVIGPITTRSEFEMFAEDAAGRTLHVYGQAAIR